jgi:anaerobic ribonucleoside-triphosphate reductase activating protein
VLWVQGCPFRCPGCVAPENQPFRGGRDVNVASLADELIRLPDIEGVTFSGGEPLAQAAALVNLVDSIRRKRDLSFMSYTGYTLEYLRRQGTPAQKSLLRRLDLLIDGPYIADRHTDLRWRGSDNQRVHLLTARYRHLEQQLQDRGYWLELVSDSEGGLFWMGIPPKDFREAYEREMQGFGVSLTISE